jgi:hypothetical protein
VVEHGDQAPLPRRVQHGAHEAASGDAVPAPGDHEPAVVEIEAVEREGHASCLSVRRHAPTVPPGTTKQCKLRLAALPGSV